MLPKLCWVFAFLFTACPLLSAAQEPAVLLTADRGGALLPYSDGPGEAASGGAARMASLLDKQRLQNPVLLLDGGNAFFGSANAFGKPGLAVRDLYDTLGYDVVNIGYRDFRFGLDVTRELLAEASFVPVSANLRGADGELLFEAFARKEVGHRTIAVIGLTSIPPGLDHIPHLQRQLAGITFDDPLEALATVLPRAREGADDVVVLCYGDRGLLQDLQAQSSLDFDAIAVGGVRPDELPRQGPRVVIASTRDGRHVTRLSLAEGSAAELLEIGPDLEPDPEVREVLAGLMPPKFVLLEPTSQPLAANDAITLGTPLPVDVHSSEPGFGGGLILGVTSVEQRSTWQGLEAPPGKSWLVFAVEVENDIPSSLALGGSRQAGEKLLVVQRQKLFLVCGEDAHTVVAATMVDKGEDPAALLPTSFVLDRVGQERSGEIGFAVHPDAIARGVLQLRLYHDEVPVAAVDVRGTAPADDSAVAAENAYVAMATPTVSFPEHVGGREPPAGSRWVVAGLRGRSLTVRPAFYLEAASHLELLVDGLWARRAELELGTLPPEPTFLPDRFAGGSAVFLAPLEARSLELSCAFPIIGLESGEKIQPETIRFTLEGEPVAPEPEQAAIVVDDGPLPLAIISVEHRQAVGDLQAAEGRTLLLFDCRVEARTDGGMFAPRGRFLLADAAAVATLGLADLPLIEPFLVPAGGRRAFRVVLDAPDSAGGPVDVTYAGVTVRPTFPIGVTDEPLDLPSRTASEPETSPDSPPPSPLELGAVWREHATPVSEPGWVFEPGPLDIDVPPVSRDGLTLTVRGASVSEVLGTREAGPEELLLELDLELVLDPDAAPLDIKGLNTCLLGVLDRQRSVNMLLLRRKEDLKSTLELEAGEPLRGKVVFAFPRAGARSFSLELFVPDRAGLHAEILPPTPAFPEPFDARSNRAFDVEVLGFAAHTELDGRPPPPGRVFVAIDLRARNHLAGESLPAGKLVWNRMADRTQVVLDGVHPLAPYMSPPGNFPRDPALLPTTNLGGRLVFQIAPERLMAARSVELVCGFEPVEIPGGGLLYPQPLVVPLAGVRPEFELPSGGHRVEDVDCTVSMSPLQEVANFRDRAPTRGSKWLTSEIWIGASAERGVTIAPKRRFQLLDGSGEAHQMYKSSWSGPSPSVRGRPFWIPAGERRTLTAAFLVPEDVVEGSAILHRGLLHVGTVPPGPVDAIEAPEPRGLAGVGLKPREVNQAIDRGRDFLWDTLREAMRKGELQGARDDYPAILALVHCKAHELYPEFDQAMRRWLASQKPRELGVYRLGLVAMIVDAVDDPVFDGLLQETLLCLVESQGPEGSWSYNTKLPDRLFPEPTPVDEEPTGPFTLEVVGGEPPQLERTEAERIERTQSWYSNKDGDNSVSQFAVLGLAAAERHELLIDRDTWRRTLGSYSERQHLPDRRAWSGGWGYATSAAYGSMTCAGICSTAIGLRRFDPTADPRLDLRIREGLGWLDRNWTVSENPATNNWDYYYLYGIERVGRILGIEFIGDHEWYPLGAKFLVGAQKQDGSWVGRSGESKPRIATSFALLFLTRATESLELDEKPETIVASGPGTLQTQIDLPPGGDSVYVILDASGSMLSKIEGRRKFDIARDAVRELSAGLPDGTPFALRVYGHRKRAIEDGAEKDTELLAPFAELDRRKLATTLDGLRARGKTPLTLSLEQARGDLAKAPRDRKTLVVLLTDGGEDTRQDPVAAARSWARRADVRLMVVGFDIDRPEWTRQLLAIAEAAGGQYLPVENADDLAAQVVAAVVLVPPLFEVRDAGDQVVAQDTFGASVPLEPGEYTLTFQHLGQPVTTSFWIRPERTTRVRFDPAPAE